MQDANGLTFGTILEIAQKVCAGFPVDLPGRDEACVVIWFLTKDTEERRGFVFESSMPACDLEVDDSLRMIHAMKTGSAFCNSWHIDGQADERR